MEDEIEDLVRRVVEAVAPLRIVLFGSRSRGDAQATSDVDLLVVVPDGTHRRRTAQTIYGRLIGLPLSVDVVVATPSVLSAHRDRRDLIYWSALREGKDLYAA